MRAEQRSALLFCVLLVCCAPARDKPSSGDPPPTLVSESASATARIAGVRTLFTRATRNGESAAVAAGTGVRFEFDGRYAHPLTGGASPTKLPLSAADPVLVSARDGRTISISLAGARAVSLSAADGLALYSDALPGVDWIHHPRADGLEDYLVLAAHRALEYRIDVSEFAGLRLVSNVLELVDASGTPRLHMVAPAVIDRTGESRRISLELASDGPEACRADRDPRAPWGRTPVAPGSSVCRVRLLWDDAGLAYPVLVDPLWTTTGSMALPRYEHAAVALQSGKVLLTGGWDDPTGSDLYDPTTGTFASAGTMPTGGNVMRGERLSDGRAVVASGTSGQVYDPTTGSWTATQALPNAVGRGGMVRLPSGLIFASGGGGAATYDASTNAWTDVGPPLVSHNYGTVTLLQSGKVLVVGSNSSPNTELYDPTTGSWSLTQALNQQRQAQAVVLLPNGKALAVGGQKCGGCEFTNTCELYDPATNAWTFTGSLIAQRMEVISTLLPNNYVLTPGGWASGNLATSAVELYDITSGTWTGTTPMASTRREDTLSPLPGGKFLVAGGADVNYQDLSSAEVFGLLSQGDSCASSGECGTGQCADGVCCNTACAGTCQACTAAKKGSGQNGTCGPIASGTDPDSECPDNGVATCGGNGSCNGAGACALYASGTICYGPVCAAGVLTTGTCTGSGTCVQSPQQCAPFVCSSGTACGASCSTDTDCALAAWCRSADGTCQPDLAKGAACTSASQCQSGYCVDGVCCDSPCNGLCQACSAALKQSGSGDGVCDFALAGADPHGSCPDDGSASCQRDGSCDGAGACRIYPAGSACGTTACVGNVQSGFACDGVGTCQANSSTDCGSYLCVQDKCATSCTSDAECVDSAWCDAGQCVDKSKPGEACQTAQACSSGFCADGVCCDAACTGQCEACDVAGAEGTCVPVSGDPKNGRPACSGATSADAPCTARACDGIDGTTCAGWVGAAVSCRAAGCTDGVATKAATCDGKGSCPAAKNQDCEPYACGGQTCLTSCSSDPDCATGAVCNASTKHCDRADLCADDQTLKHADGTTEPCTPYVCKAGACRKSCASIADCVAPNVCDATGHCSALKPAAASNDSGGCSCRVQGRRSSPVGLLAALGLWALVGRRRQRNS